MNQSFNLAVERFQSTYMSDAKWSKLLDHLTDALGEIHFYYKLIYNDEEKQSVIDLPDPAPFFSEPIHYREVEWVEFPCIYEGYVSHSNLKAGRKYYSQDIDEIEKIIRSIGQFLLERSEGSLKLYVYR